TSQHPLLRAPSTPVSSSSVLSSSSSSSHSDDAGGDQGTSARTAVEQGTSLKTRSASPSSGRAAQEPLFRDPRAPQVEERGLLQPVYSSSPGDSAKSSYPPSTT
ncbi:unnamed protein product, partial [Amoebophrya sp. A120]